MGHGVVKALGFVVALFSVAANATLVTFDVDANGHSSSGALGLNTGLSFNTGDSITGFVATDDLWNAGALPRWSNADGLITDLYATGTDDSGEAAGTLIGTLFPNYTSSGFTAPYGSLVGSINGTFFLLGTSFNVSAPDAGVLSLFYWDSNSGDNTEFVTVSIDNGQTVTTTGVPVPAVVWLLMAGLTGMTVQQKRRSVS